MVNSDAFCSLLCWAISRFSSTLIPANRRMFWKVRATPASLEMRKPGIRSRSSSRPEVGRNVNRPTVGA